MAKSNTLACFILQLRHWVVATLGKGVTAGYPSSCEPATSQDSIFSDCIIGILGTRRLVAANGRQNSG